jgi:hypothetical protein
MKHIPCSRQTKPSCGAPCKKIIPTCGHECGRFCHDGDCIDSTHPCTKRCGITRSCGHICQYPCHGVRGCLETLVCKQLVVSTCPCGHLKIKRQCGTRIGFSDIDHSPIECSDVCLRHQRGEKMAAALKIDINAASRIGPFVGWEEKVIKLGLSYPSIVVFTEKKLMELVSDLKFQYYYFPEQKLLKINTLIAQIATNYGFLSEIVDERVGKPNVIVRRLKNHNPSIPNMLLSQLCKNYKMENPLFDKFIIRNEEYDTRNTRINGMYFTGVKRQVTADLIWSHLKNELTMISHNVSLFWMDDDQCFIYYKHIDNSGVVSDQTLIAENADTMKIDASATPDICVSNETELCQVENVEVLQSVCIPELNVIEKSRILLQDLVSTIEEISVSPVGGIHFLTGKISHYKRRNVSSFRMAKELGWEKASVSWKDDGIVLAK